MISPFPLSNSMRGLAPKRRGGIAHINSLNFAWSFAVMPLLFVCSHICTMDSVFLDKNSSSSESVHLTREIFWRAHDIHPLHTSDKRLVSPRERKPKIITNSSGKKCNICFFVLSFLPKTHKEIQQTKKWRTSKFYCYSFLKKKICYKQCVGRFYRHGIFLF